MTPKGRSYHPKVRGYHRKAKGYPSKVRGYSPRVRGYPPKVRGYSIVRVRRLPANKRPPSYPGGPCMNMYLWKMCRLSGPP